LNSIYSEHVKSSTTVTTYTSKATTRFSSALEAFYSTHKVELKAKAAASAAFKVHLTEFFATHRTTTASTTTTTTTTTATAYAAKYASLAAKSTYAAALQDFYHAHYKATTATAAASATAVTFGIPTGAGSMGIPTGFSLSHLSRRSLRGRALGSTIHYGTGINAGTCQRCQREQPGCDCHL
jgi:hypothetical protein